MKNKLLVAAVLLLLGGFMVGDAAGLNLVAQVGARNRSKNHTAVTPLPGANTESACKAEFKRAEDAYKVAVREAKQKRDLAVRAKNACLQVAKKNRPSATPTPTASVTP